MAGGMDPGILKIPSTPNHSVLLGFLLPSSCPAAPREGAAMRRPPQPPLPGAATPWPAGQGCGAERRGEGRPRCGEGGRKEGRRQGGGRKEGGSAIARLWEARGSRHAALRGAGQRRGEDRRGDRPGRGFHQVSVPPLRFCRDSPGRPCRDSRAVLAPGGCFRCLLSGEMISK